MYGKNKFTTKKENIKIEKLHHFQVKLNQFKKSSTLILRKSVSQSGNNDESQIYLKHLNWYQLGTIRPNQLILHVTPRLILCHVIQQLWHPQCGRRGCAQQLTWDWSDRCPSSRLPPRLWGNLMHILKRKINYYYSIIKGEKSTFNSVKIKVR